MWYPGVDEELVRRRVTLKMVCNGKKNPTALIYQWERHRKCKKHNIIDLQYL